MTTENTTPETVATEEPYDARGANVRGIAHTLGWDVRSITSVTFAAGVSGDVLVIERDPNLAFD